MTIGKEDKQKEKEKRERQRGKRGAMLLPVCCDASAWIHLFCSIICPALRQLRACLMPAASRSRRRRPPNATTRATHTLTSQHTRRAQFRLSPQTTTSAPAISKKKAALCPYFLRRRRADSGGRAAASFLSLPGERAGDGSCTSSHRRAGRRRGAGFDGDAEVGDIKRRQHAGGSPRGSSN